MASLGLPKTFKALKMSFPVSLWNWKSCVFSYRVESELIRVQRQRSFCWPQKPLQVLNSICWVFAGHKTDSKIRGFFAQIFTSSFCLSSVLINKSICTVWLYLVDFFSFKFWTEVKEIKFSKLPLPSAGRMLGAMSHCLVTRQFLIISPLPVNDNPELGT